MKDHTSHCSLCFFLAVNFFFPQPSGFADFMLWIYVCRKWKEGSAALLLRENRFPIIQYILEYSKCFPVSSLRCDATFLFSYFQISAAESFISLSAARANGTP